MNFAAIIAVIQAVANLLPTIISLVSAVEAALPASGQGAAKMTMIKGALQSAYSVEQNASVAFEQVWPTLQTTISGLVAAYNASGIFKKG